MNLSKQYLLAGGQHALKFCRQKKELKDNIESTIMGFDFLLDRSLIDT